MSYDRKIIKPVTVPVCALFKNAGPITPAADYTLDTTTGIATYTPTANSAASNVTAGNSTLIEFSSNISLSNGQKVYLTGFTGANASLLNSLAHTINGITGNGPYTFNVATNTYNTTITTGNGKGWNYPQATDNLTWTGEFDTPVRFDSDLSEIAANPAGLLDWSNVQLIELKDGL